VPSVVVNVLKWADKDMLEVTIELDGSMKLKKVQPNE